MRHALLSVLLLSLVGCTSFEYEVVKPDRLATKVNDIESRLKMDPMVYGLRAKEDRLVMTIQNPLDEQVQLVGEKSAVVDSKGQSHPIRGQAIAPHSYAKLILPPLRPRFERNPDFTFGVGEHSRVDSNTLPANQTPIYLDIYEDLDNRYWDWDGETQIRLQLTYERPGGKTWTDEFVIQRRKAQ